MTDIALRLFSELGEITISFNDSADGTCELMAANTMSLYLSFVRQTITAGLTFIFVSSEKGKGIKIISPVCTISFLSNLDRDFRHYPAKS